MAPPVTARYVEVVYVPVAFVQTKSMADPVPMVTLVALRLVPLAVVNPR